MRQLDRQITLQVLQEVRPADKWGESRLIYRDAPVWAYRAIHSTILLGPTQGEDFTSRGLRASWVIRHRNDIQPEATGFTDAEGRKWRIESVRELPEKGRERFMELQASTITAGSGVPPARR